VGAAAPPPVRVLAKPVRRYVHRAFWPRQRLALLLEHYRWLRALFSRDFLARLCAEAPLPVVGLSGRRGGEYELFVIAANAVYMQREGELAIVVAGRPSGRELCRLSLCFARVDGEPAIVVVGLQGPASIFKRDVIDATRDLYGLRPKDAALLAARALGRALGFNVLHAICDANHVLRRLQDKAKFSRYDDYWAERGGKRRGPFGFVFGPLEDKRRARVYASGRAASSIVRAAEDDVVLWSHWRDLVTSRQACAARRSTAVIDETSAQSLAQARVSVESRALNADCCCHRS
jgi:uncharacterized protein VirK/YbjX